MYSVWIVSMTTTVMLQFEIHSIHSKLMYSWKKKTLPEIYTTLWKGLHHIDNKFYSFFVKQVLLESNEIK